MSAYTHACTSVMHMWSEGSWWNGFSPSSCRFWLLSSGSQAWWEVLLPVIKFLVRYMICRYFLPFCRLPFKKYRLIFLFCLLPVYLFAHCLCARCHGGQREVSDPWELQFRQLWLLGTELSAVRSSMSPTHPGTPWCSPCLGWH